jgi:hypothetical protein
MPASRVETAEAMPQPSGRTTRAGGAGRLLQRQQAGGCSASRLLKLRFQLEISAAVASLRRRGGRSCRVQALAVLAGGAGGRLQHQQAAEATLPARDICSCRCCAATKSAKSTATAEITLVTLTGMVHKALLNICQLLLEIQTLLTGNPLACHTHN